MILKASQRGGGKQLGLHLLKTEENEHVEVHEIRGFVSDDVVGAMKEAYAVSLGTKCKQFLFSVSLNPPETESVGVNVFENAADRIEEKTGLTGQPRVIVFHEKEGRRHAHAVWSRIDIDSMTAVNLSHFKVKLRDISKELYLENDWQMPRGLMDSQARDPRNFSLVEWQQAKRMGVEARDLKAEMQECWAVSDSRAAFEHALGERGIILAKGDRRGHVAVTHHGEVLSVARYVGKKAKDVRAKLGELENLASVDEAKARMARDMAAAFRRHVQEARLQHSQEAARLEHARQQMTAAHTAERRKLDAAQQARWLEEARQRQARMNSGLRGLWDRLTGQHGRLQRQNEQDAYAALQRDRQQRDAMVEAQLQERRGLQQQIRDERQRQAELLIELRQDSKPYMAAIAEQVRSQPRVVKPPTQIPEAHGPPDRQTEAQTSPMAVQFERVAALRTEPQEHVPEEKRQVQTPEDRLRNLRGNQPRPSAQQNKGPEHER